MKYGANLDKESVPGWRFHNVDYNSLKHYIKVHTTKNQATAIAIPGHTDTALAKVEDELYLELCRQHDRVGLFVASKANEISRRLQHLQTQIARFAKKQRHLAARQDDASSITGIRRQRKLAKLEGSVISCGEEIQDLQRFITAQQIAFRKILKKYKKWTGSTSLSTRIKDDVLSDPKSFLKRDYYQSLSTAYSEVLGLVDDARRSLGVFEDASSTLQGTDTERGDSREGTQSSQATYVETPTRYWNEYDDGSEGGDMEGQEEYAIYINPDQNESGSSLGLRSFVNAVKSPIMRARAWVLRTPASEQQPLLPEPATSSNYGTNSRRTSAFSSRGLTAPGLGSNQSSSTAVNTEAASDVDQNSDDDKIQDGETSSQEDFPSGYDTYYAANTHYHSDQHFALPSLAEQRKMYRYREQMLFFGTVACFTTSFLLLGISTVLIATGRHKLRVEVDAGVTMGVVIGMGCACMGLALFKARRDEMDLVTRLAGWAAFAATCVLSGVLLVLVMGNAA